MQNDTVLVQRYIRRYIHIINTSKDVVALFAIFEHWIGLVNGDSV